MIIVPHCYHGANYAKVALTAIREHYPDELVYVVDSNSVSQDYVEELESEFSNITIDLSGNPYWECGALWKGYEAFPNEPWYMLLHDTAFLVRALPKLNEHEIWIMQYFRHGFDNWPQQNWAVEQIALHAPSIEIPSPMTPQTLDQFHGIIGIIMQCSNNFMLKLKALGLPNIKATCKNEACAMERIYGLALRHLGIPPKTVALDGTSPTNTNNYMVKVSGRSRYEATPW